MATPIIRTMTKEAGHWSSSLENEADYWTDQTWENSPDLISKSLETISNSFGSTLQASCQCAHNHSNRCSNCQDNSWDCEPYFLKMFLTLSLRKCPLKVLLSHSQEHQSALNFLLTFLVLLLLKLVLHSHHWHSPDPPLRFLFVLGVMDSTFAFLDTFPYYTRDAPSCPDKTS